MSRHESSTVISVIIPAYNEAATISSCLTALMAQTGCSPFEMIVVDSSCDGTAELVRQRFPCVQLYHFDQKLYPGDARNYGASLAKGKILAFLDADCWVEPNWVSQIVAAHAENSHPVVGGAIANGNPNSYVGWGYYLSSFSQWMPQAHSFERTDIPTGCLSCKRWAFEQYGPFLEGSLCEDTYFNWVLEAAGYQALFVPTIRVFHTNIETLGHLIDRKLRHGNTFAHLRIAQAHFSYSKQWMYALGSLALPLVLTVRRARDVFKAKVHRLQFIWALPVIFIGVCCWSLGEFLAYSNISKIAKPPFFFTSGFNRFTFKFKLKR